MLGKKQFGNRGKVKITLSDWLSRNGNELTPTEEYPWQLISHYHKKVIWDSRNYEYNIQEFPFKQKHIYQWCILEDLTAVAVNQNYHRAWGYLTKKLKRLPTQKG